MITVRQIERHWESKAYSRLFAELLAARAEAAFRLGIHCDGALPAAALAIIRLDELTLSHVKLYSRLVKTLVAAQEPDGGWGDLVTTSLCLRALFCGNGNGAAIDRGLAYLAAMQKSEGIWPAIPIRRSAADPYVSAIVLYELGEHSSFRQAVRLPQAIQWFTSHGHSLDQETRNLWNRARVKCRLVREETAFSLS
jgi:hypothetical protein